ncbi:hypothetical protein SAMN05216582_11323 [Selenomonas ruminantium]|uniref:CDP-Glycerol:Poly(Glycerophosphate) glycerophosphotransferase n=1 Tax=Selenomonas ruminantium TaxID=971 RepID=A0A1M6UL98_SELRU|nr:hypothetical protein [Selenomonas ruminantium]SHK69971.1 hypothetical protein SAMN05216582_11323 [Selenomonas ruminantium]
MERDIQKDLAEMLGDVQMVLSQTKWDQPQQMNIVQSILPQLQALAKTLQEESGRKTVIYFLPYKSSMWDSLESVYLAAKDDPACEPYVMPIPYYDRNPDTSLGTMHYEGGQFPKDIPITDYRQVDLQAVCPDIIYIHNPYDYANYVTSIDPAYYSDKLKSFCKLLVYIPYYITSGAMGEGQAMCPVYEHADYIVVQSESLRHFFDKRVPLSKIVGLGSPKADKVINMCKNPPPIPKDWQEKMAGKKVYFYNTSLAGMLENTAVFFQKMRYVFRTFAQHPEVCLLWRPHPLTMATLDSIRKPFVAEYEALRDYFIEHDLGIYDDTPEIEPSIAYSDVYLGDSGTSVTALFGVAGKPLFLFNNTLHSLPKPEDWHSMILDSSFISCTMSPQILSWMVLGSNRLFYSANDDYKYEYAGELHEYIGSGYYWQAFSIGDKVYITPHNAQEILVLDKAEKKLERRIQLKEFISKPEAFAGALQAGRYLFLLPTLYPAIVRYDTVTDNVAYVEGNMEAFLSRVQTCWRRGGACIWRGKLLTVAANGRQVLMIDCETLENTIAELPKHQQQGCMTMLPDGEDIWLLPMIGKCILRWQPKSNILQEYTEFPADFVCCNIVNGVPCEDFPFSNAAITEQFLYLSPAWGNQFLRLNKATGEIISWQLDIPETKQIFGGYYSTNYPGYFLQEASPGIWHYLYTPERCIYAIELATGKAKRINIEFSGEAIDQISAGFARLSPWLRYGCCEDVFNTLDGFIKGEIHGHDFDYKENLKAFGEIAANNDGSAGEKIHLFACEQLSRKGGNDP